MEKDYSLELVRKEEQICTECGKGIYKAKNCAPEKAHDFYCDNCGSHIHIVPNVIVE